MLHIVHVLSILTCMFLIARLASLFGGKWSPFAKTNWKQDFTAALVGTMVLIWISYILLTDWENGSFGFLYLLLESGEFLRT